MQLPIIIALALLLCLGGLTLLLDARQRHLNRRVDLAMPQAHLANLPSIRRRHEQSRWWLVHLLINYKPGLAYDWPPRYVVPCGIIPAAAVAYANTYVGLPPRYISLVAIAFTLMTVRGLLGWQQGRLANRLFRQLPDVIELVTSTVRSGLPVNEAFQVIARDMPQPTAGQFAIVCNEIALGRPAAEALEGIFQRARVAEYGMFAVTLAVQLKSGGRLSETLHVLGDTVRQRVALAGRAKALAGEVIFSSKALILSPFIIGGLMYWINPQMEDMLLYDPTGRMLLAYALSSVLLGGLVIRWMVRRETTI